MKIGVLAMQGAFAEHISMFTRLKVEATPVRLPKQLKGLDGLVIPGGESTSIIKLMADYHLVEPVRNMALGGKAMLGTCAGMILLAKEISDDGGVTPLGVMDIKVRRNAFGRQVESFETDLDMPILGDKPFHAVFIRAPRIEQVYGRAEKLAMLGDGTIVAARQGKLLVTSFHPELTDDLRFHEYFINIISGKETTLPARGDFAKSNNR